MARSDFRKLLEDLVMEYETEKEAKSKLEQSLRHKDSVKD